MPPQVTATDVAVVVLNWNGWADTERCLRSLGRLDEPPGATIVVDNGSTDGSPARIAAGFPQVDLVRSTRNLGFAGGVNLGIRRALELGSDAVWILNNDAEPAADALRALLEPLARDGRVGIVGGVVRDAATGRVHSFGGGRIDRLTGVAHLAQTPEDHVEYVTGACMLVRRAVFEQIGLLDEAYFFYFEDADFGRRATAAGWRHAVAPGAHVDHRVGSTVDRAGGRLPLADILQVESSGIFLGRHRGAAAPALAAVRLAGIVVNRARRGQLSRVPLLARSLFAGVRKGAASPRPAPPTRPAPPSRPSA